MKRNIKRMFHHYEKWEDYRAGMYKNAGNLENYEDLILSAKNLLSNEGEFYQAALQVINNWPIACEQNLSNTGMNRQAWIGSASCCLKYGVPDELTKVAWNAMTEEEQDKANKIADIIIEKWENKHILEYAEKVSR